MHTNKQCRLAVLAVLGVGVAAPGALGASARAAVAKGADCNHPFRVTYAHGRLTGDTKRISVQVTRSGSHITVAWHAVGRTRFCSITGVEGLGQKFSSRNPAAKFAYTDYTANHSNGIKSVTATARSA
jgi:hypothetical protein